MAWLEIWSLGWHHSHKTTHGRKREKRKREQEKRSSPTEGEEGYLHIQLLLADIHTHGGREKTTSTRLLTQRPHPSLCDEKAESIRSTYRSVTLVPRYLYLTLCHLAGCRWGTGKAGEAACGMGVRTARWRSRGAGVLLQEMRVPRPAMPMTSIFLDSRRVSVGRWSQRF